MNFKKRLVILEKEYKQLVNNKKDLLKQIEQLEIKVAGVNIQMIKKQGARDELKRLFSQKDLNLKSFSANKFKKLLYKKKC